MEAPDNPEFWNRAAATREFTHPLDHDPFVRAAFRDARILDYGCGQGRLAAELVALRYTQVLGMDSSPEMIRVARERVPAASFLVNDGERLPFADATLDVVLLFAVLTCIPTDDIQNNLVREFKRTLRPGGLLLMAITCSSRMSATCGATNSSRQSSAYRRFRLPDGAVVRHHPVDWFDELLADFPSSNRSKSTAGR